jgi:hypothetical protein
VIYRHARELTDAQDLTSQLAALKARQAGLPKAF